MHEVCNDDIITPLACCRGSSMGVKMKHGLNEFGIYAAGPTDDGLRGSHQASVAQFPAQRALPI